MKVLDLFSGPGGWDVGAKALGLDPLGIEYDDAACATREAAGHRTVQQDVSLLDPNDFQADLLIASPPCQAWSMAGKRQGQEDIEKVYEWSRTVRVDEDGTVSNFEWADPRSCLVVEPLRWALALRPSYLAWEQVPPVLDYWKFCADILRAEGYSVWTGILSAERYGVPQTRKRAILMASLDGPVEPPRPTHQAYTAGESAWLWPMVSLEGELLPWVSMAEALGWGTLDRPTPTPTLAVGKTGDGRVFGSDERAAPKFAGQEWKLRNNAQENAAERAATDPAPTITGAHDSGERRWTQERPSPTIVGTRRSKDGPLVGRQLPAGEGENIGGKNWTPHLSDEGWEETRPATTLAGDPRIFPPGGHIANDGRDNSRMVGRPENAVRVTIEEAAILQGFDPSYPWQGSRTKQFQQIGNAVPPPLAQAILAALTASVRAEKEAA